MGKSVSKFTLGIVLIIAVIALLEWSEKIEVSAVILAVAALYALGKTIQMGRLWWRGSGNRIAGRERSLKFLACMMAFFLTTGAMLYLWAFGTIAREDGTTFVNSEYLLRSLACSLKLFMFDIDSNVLDHIAYHHFIKGAIVIQAALSFCCTVSFLIGLVNARIKAYLKLRKLVKIHETGKNHLYIFFGMNEPSETLAKSIQAEDDKSLIIFVENTNVNKDEPEGWNSIVQLFAVRQKAFIDVEELNAYVSFTDSSLSEIADGEVADEDILDKMNLHKVKEIISNLQLAGADSQLHVFFLSENEDENVHNTSILTHDVTISQTVKADSVSVKFYCHARLNGINRTIEDEAMHRDIDIRVIDYSRLSIDSLKMNPTEHPARVVKFDCETKPGCAVSEFNALIVGFNWCGQDALSYLYEFGAFVDGDTLNRSHFQCTAVDRDMDSIAGLYRATHPQVCKATNQDGSPLVNFVKCDFKGDTFYESALGPNRHTLNHIVIAVGDDEAGINLAINIFKYIRRVRHNLSSLRIYVRTYNKGKTAFMKRIAQHYNDGCGASEPIIRIFGDAHEIYSYKMIVDPSNLKKARRFFARYSTFKHENPDWDRRHMKELGFIRKDGTVIPMADRRISLDNLRKIRRKEGQDLSNAFHAATKEYIFEQAVKPENRDCLIVRYFGADGEPLYEGKMQSIRYTKLSDFENTLVRNLAILEHLRWNAAHEMLGYEPTEPADKIHSCDEERHKHNCLRPWAELDAESAIVTASEGWDCDYKIYDFGVVDTTLDLYKQRLGYGK